MKNLIVGDFYFCYQAYSRIKNTSPEMLNFTDFISLDLSQQPQDSCLPYMQWVTPGTSEGDSVNIEHSNKVPDIFYKGEWNLLSDLKWGKESWYSRNKGELVALWGNVLSQPWNLVSSFQDSNYSEICSKLSFRGIQSLLFLDNAKVEVIFNDGENKEYDKVFWSNHFSYLEGTLGKDILVEALKDNKDYDLKSADFPRSLQLSWEVDASESKVLNRKTFSFVTSFNKVKHIVLGAIECSDSRAKIKTMCYLSEEHVSDKKYVNSFKKCVLRSLTSSLGFKDLKNEKIYVFSGAFGSRICFSRLFDVKHPRANFYFFGDRATHSHFDEKLLIKSAEHASESHNIGLSL